MFNWSYLLWTFNRIKIIIWSLAVILIQNVPLIESWFTHLLDRNVRNYWRIMDVTEIWEKLFLSKIFFLAVGDYFFSFSCYAFWEENKRTYFTLLCLFRSVFIRKTYFCIASWEFIRFWSDILWSRVHPFTYTGFTLVLSLLISDSISTWT